MRKPALALVAFLAAISALSGTAEACAGSSINPALPSQASGLSSAVIRTNFQGAYNDVNNLIRQFGGISAPASPCPLQLWANTSVVPYLLNIFDGTTWVVTAALDPVGHTYSPLVGTAAANTVYAGPSSGIPAVPTFRALTLTDLPGVGTAATYNIGTSGATVPLLSGNNTWSGQNNFAAVGLGNVLSTAAAAVNQTFSSTAVDGGLVYNLSAASATMPELSGIFRMTSGIGSTNPLSAWKQALGAEDVCNSGSADCWAFTSILTVNSGMGAATHDILSAEIDENNDDADCPNGDPGTSATNNVYCGEVYISGAGSHNLNFGLAIQGGNHILNGVVFTTAGPTSADILNYSTSVNLIDDEGAHSGNGLYASNATYGGNFIVGPGGTFIVGPGGSVTAAGLTLTGPPSGTPATDACFTAGGAVISAARCNLTAPTISSGFGTSPTVPNNQGPAAFTVNVGTGGSATSGVVGLPAAAHGWNCFAVDASTQSSTVFVTKMTATTTTTATIGNFNTSGAAAAWSASDILHVSCFSY